MMERLLAEMDVAGAPGARIEPGELTLTATAQVRFAIAETAAEGSLAPAD